ncbi:Tau-tubulin kinase 1 [Trichinella nelsoni]|uniref:Tau-tubulin kinase 1 n=1 Tax=Trichinella nelsoni TaxID=6336 RepID=A0A0V0RGX8_9BILA|nr:Tau-tubulin kinase 1 [Trichinella nelsoni]
MISKIDFYFILLLHFSSLQDSLQNVAFQYPAPGCIQIKVMGGYLTPVTGCVIHPQKPTRGQKYIEQVPLGGKCFHHNECPDQSMCVQFRCEVAEPTGWKCDQYDRCGPDEACKHGICFKVNEKFCSSDRDCPRYMLCRRNRCVPERDHREKEREKFCPGRRRPYFKGNHPLSCDPRVTIDMCPKGFYCDRKTSYCCEDYTDDEYDSEVDIELGEPCTYSKRRNPCRPKHSECIRSVCRCIRGYVERDRQCVPVRSSGSSTLGKSCSTVADCNFPYAQCAKGECTCRSGYLLDVDTCKPQVYNCPTGAPIVINNKVVQCTVQFFPDREDPEDSCPENTFCVSYGSPPARNRHKRSSTLAEGFCCPKINSICPVGAPHHCPNDDCQRHCPKNTHFCHKSGGYEWKEVCCDKPCLNGDVFENGQCVPERSSKRFFGGLRCSTAADCRSAGMVCRNNDKASICVCDQESIFLNGNCVELKCPVGKPQKTENGKFVYCNGSCSNKEYYCDEQLRICCSKMKNYSLFWVYTCNRIIMPNENNDQPQIVNLEIGSTFENRWKVLSKLGEGQFGAVYCVQDLKRRGKKYALKVEQRNQSNAVLKMDTLVLLKLRGNHHVCQFIRCGRNETMNYLVMALVGSNMDVLRKSMPEKRFSLGTVCKIAIQCTRALRDIHMAGFVHRDIKPANIAVGINSERNIIKILDFGLARKFRDGDGVIRPPRDKPGFRGTVLYASINAHNDLELGRQDDFLSTYYTLIEFLNGSLTWENCATVEEVLHAKKQMPNVWNEQLPKPLNDIYKHLESLDYHTEPNYSWIVSQFKQCAIENDINLNDPFDWNKTTQESDMNSKIAVIVAQRCVTIVHLLLAAEGRTWKRLTLKHCRRPMMQVTLVATVIPVPSTPAEEDILCGYCSSNGSMVQSATNIDFSSGKHVEVAVKATKIDQEKRDIKEIAQHSRRDDQNMMMTIAVTKTTPRLIFMKQCYNFS